MSVVAFEGGAFLAADIESPEVFTPEDFNADQLAFAEAARNFVRKEVLPVSDRIEDKEAGLMRSLIGKAGEIGLLMADVPEEYGGLDLDKVSSALIAENVSLQPSFMTSMNGHTGIGMLPIVFYGSDELKARYLPLMVTGSKIGAYALTEPGAGSDALACRTRAVLSPDGRHYILNGTKQFITNSGFADVFTVFAKVDGEHFTGFVVDRDAPGFRVGPEEHKMGLKGSSTTTLILEDAMTPVENVLGEIGKGHKIAFNVLNIGRFKVGTQSMGCAKEALREALAYTLQRRQFGKAIAQFGAVREKLARMYANIYAAESISYRTIGMIDRALSKCGDGPEEKLKAIEGYSVECAIVKVYCSEALDYVTDESLQCFGGYGYSAEYPVERYYRDARITRIYEGTNEINRVLIPTMLLRRWTDGIPRREADGTGEAFRSPLREWVDMLRDIALAAFGEALRLHGKSLFSRQMELTRLADLSILCYVAQSAVLRAEKDVARRGLENAALPLAAARITVESALDAALPLGRQLEGALGTEKLNGLLEKALLRPTPDVLQDMETIAARLVEAERLVI